MLDTAQEDEAAAKDALDSSSTASASGSQLERRGGRQNYRQMNNPNAQSIPDAFQTDTAMQVAYDNAKQHTLVMQKCYDAKITALAEFKEEYCITYDDFFA